MLSEDLLDEYIRVLSKPDLFDRHRLTTKNIEAFLSGLRASGRTVNPLPLEHHSHISPDTKDQHLWDLLFAEPAAILVTGERRLQENAPAGRQVLSPREFVEHYLEPPVE